MIKVNICHNSSLLKISQTLTIEASVYNIPLFSKLFPIVKILLVARKSFVGL